MDCFLINPVNGRLVKYNMQIQDRESCFRQNTIEYKDHEIHINACPIFRNNLSPPRKEFELLHSTFNERIVVKYMVRPSHPYMFNLFIVRAKDNTDWYKTKICNNEAEPSEEICAKDSTSKGKMTFEYYFTITWLGKEKGSVERVKWIQLSRLEDPIGEMEKLSKSLIDDLVQ
jgi:hypothetical protein